MSTHAHDDLRAERGDTCDSRCVRTRRDFCKALAFATAVAAAPLTLSVLPVAARERESTSPKQATPQPVVSFHLDQPYLDVTGRDVPYRPATGLRSARVIGELSDEALQYLLYRV